MVDVAPFRGLRYRAADPALVTAPPYDAIDARLQRELHDRHPNNVVRLELGEAYADDCPGRDRYVRAAACLDRWVDDGVLVRDDRPTLTVYEQDFGSGRQRGVLAALGLEAWESGLVLPHERIFRPPVEDRLQLLEALPVNTSPVYVLADVEPEPVREALDETTRAAPTLDFSDGEDGVRHRVWVVDDDEVLAAVRTGYGDVRLLMADGHHRYTTALEYRDRHRGELGVDAVLAFVVGASTGRDDAISGPAIRPMHRLVRRLPADTLARLRAVGIDVTPAVPEDLQRAVDDGAATFGLITADGAWRLSAGPEADALRPRDAPAAVRDLDASLLRALLLGPLEVEDRIEELLYTADADRALAAVDRGDADGLVLVRAVGLDEVRRVAEAGARMPPKTTSFFPKPRTGLVLRPLDRAPVT